MNYVYTQRMVRPHCNYSRYSTIGSSDSAMVYIMKYHESIIGSCYYLDEAEFERKLLEHKDEAEVDLILDELEAEVMEWIDNESLEY